MKFGSKLKLLRTMRNLDQHEMSKLLHISQPVYSRYECDQKEMKQDDSVIDKVAEIFEISKEWLTGEHFNPYVVFESGSIATGATGAGVVGQIENYYAVPKEFLNTHIKQQELLEKLLTKLMDK